MKREDFIMNKKNFKDKKKFLNYIHGDKVNVFIDGEKMGNVQSLNILFEPEKLAKAEGNLYVLNTMELVTLQKDAEGRGGSGFLVEDMFEKDGIFEIKLVTAK